MGVKRPIPSGDKKKKMMGNILEEVVNSESIPEEFDARKYFPECAEVIATIQASNQLIDLLKKGLSYGNPMVGLKQSEEAD